MAPYKMIGSVRDLTIVGVILQTYFKNTITHNEVLTES